jgi:putative ABC transport system permease protein
MFRNYLIVALRTLWRDKVHSTINVLGLGLGVLCCVLIAIYVKDEWTFDRFHSKVDRIYRVYVKEDWGEKQQFNNTVTPFPMGPALKENFSEVISHVRLNTLGAQTKVGDQVFNDQVTVGGQDLFKVFDFELTSGDDSALDRQDAVILSEELATKYFGSVNPLDKVIAIQLGDRFEDFTVKGVVSIPTNSSISFDLLISDLNYPRLYSSQALTSAWFNVIPETYVLLQEGVDPHQLQAKFSPVFKTLLGEEDFKNSKYFVGLQPMTSIHLDTTLPLGIAPVSDPKYSYILSGIALLILFVACINFVTLSVGRSLHRSKEVGIRKVVGAQRKQLIVQFLGESVVVTIVSILAGLIGASLCLPLFNDLAGKQLEFPMNLFMAGTVLVLLTTIGVITGSYPAFVLSSFRPITILKGALPKGKQGFRKALVGLQLVLSIFLISSTLVMRQQLQFLQDKNLGFSKEQLAVVQLAVPRARLTERVTKGFEIADQFKTELSRLPEIESICGSSHDFGNGGWTNIGFTDDNSVYRTFNLNIIDDEYIPAMRMEMASGRNFSDSNPSDRRRSIIVNEALVREYGWKDAIGKRLPGKKFVDHEIIGVVKDFNYSSLYTAVTPLVMVEDAAIAISGMENINIDNSPVPKLLIRIKAGMLTAGIARIEEAWKKINGSEEFSFAFVDQSLNRQYRNDQNLGRMVSLATALSILIGSLGLYALASLAMQTRTKEISIRKVMGATVQSLLVLLSREYLILVGISLVFSVPLTFWMMDSWLETFEYRITIGWGIFLAAGAVSLGIALLAIGHQTLKTAAAEPAETLRYD